VITDKADNRFEKISGSYVTAITSAILEWHLDKPVKVAILPAPLAQGTSFINNFFHS
jgi:hypothetical protein